MCSFIVINKPDIDFTATNRYLKQRGRDKTNYYFDNNYSVVHNLLHITGGKIVQPYIKLEYLLVYNGEIYNYKNFGDYKSDTECIIDLFIVYGEDFVHHIDGEYAGVIVNLETQKMFPFVDRFACKPLWCGIEENSIVGYATYESGLDYDFIDKTKKMHMPHRYKNFSLKQHKNTYDDWTTAFENSIKKRTRNTNKKIFLGLSSGYDSGAIACELTKQNCDFKAFTIIGGEDQSIISERKKRIKNCHVLEFYRDEYDLIKNTIGLYCEQFEYSDKFDRYKILNDKAAIGLAAICRMADTEDYRIYLSGQGADEIISDYGNMGTKIYDHSEFGGVFPEELKGFFPWHSFYDGTQIKYLNKEEYVAGAHNIETRYPYLDFVLVQEFIWLSPKLKNSYYKAPLRHYLLENKFPFAEGIKIGFGANKNLL